MERGANSAGAAFKHIVVERVLAMDRVGINDDELWDEDDGFFYDVLCLPNGRCTRLKVRSMVVPESVRHPRFLRLDFLTSKSARLNAM
jgi:hypothetical protein